MSDIVEVIANFSGIVQGVFFRSKIKKHAEQLDICGTVENLSDGSVELVAIGKKEQLDRLISNIKKDPGNARIDHVSVSFNKPTKVFEDFKIVR